jgi:hypothetical protein
MGLDHSSRELGTWYLTFMVNTEPSFAHMRIVDQGWIWEWTPAFIGVGMLTGINASYSFLGGVRRSFRMPFTLLLTLLQSFLAWAIIGPVIVAKGLVSTTNVMVETTL